jgi:hypothetical protein
MPKRSTPNPLLPIIDLARRWWLQGERETYSGDTREETRGFQRQMDAHHLLTLVLGYTYEQALDQQYAWNLIAEMAA